MKYKGVDLTFENYSDHLSEFSQDIKDEVRSAILDNTPIGKFVDVCRDNPFRLQQIRLAIKESYPTWVLKITDGYNIYRIRNLEGVSMDVVESYVSEGLPSEYVEELISWLEAGVTLPSDFDFKRIPKGILKPVSKAIKYGIDPDDIVKLSKGDEEYAELYYQISLKGLSLGIFYDKNLSKSALRMVAELTGRPYISSVVDVLESRSDEHQVDVLWELAKIGFDLTSLEDEYYNSVQLFWIHQAYSEKLDVTEMLDNELNNEELSHIYHNLVSNRTKRLSGRL